MKTKIKIAGGAAVLALIAAVLLVAPASGGAGERITGLSHKHPEGADYSIFCGKVKGKPGRRYVAKAIGPSFPEGIKIRFEMHDSGREHVDYVIHAAGEYTLVLKKAGSGTFVDSKSYNVPPPPPDGAAEGPFRCLQP